MIKNKPISALLTVGAFGCGAFTAWCIYANDQFSYTGKRKLSRQIVEGVAEYVTLPEGGVGLDVSFRKGDACKLDFPDESFDTVTSNYQKHFKDPIIHRFHMEHEELLVLHPEQWAAKIKEVCI